MDILIDELNPTESNIIVESADGGTSGKTLWLQGVFMQSELKNRNGRVYPLREISKAVNNATSKISETNGIFGELDHPQSLTINLDRVSHVITEMKMVGNNAIGRAKMLDTPMGILGKTLIDSGVRVGISSRGAGQMTEDVVNGFMFVTADLVATPSAPGALPDSIYESLDLNRHGREAISLSEQVREDLRAQEYLKRSILKFLTDIQWQKR